uniref:Uncharacterized protein n=1 Tax=Ciona savignyi TaxID=51511 RepID=H2Z927_CIOSA
MARQMTPNCRSHLSCNGLTSHCASKCSEQTSKHCGFLTTHSRTGSMLDWPGVKTGFHSMPSNCAIPSDVDDDVNKPASSKMEDAIRKTEMILQSLKTQMAVQAWAVEHFSSFAIGSVAAAEGKGFRIKIDLSKLMSEKPKILIAIVSIVLVIIGLVVASTFLF